MHALNDKALVQHGLLCIYHEIIVLKCQLNWLDQQTTSQTQALLPAQQFSFFCSIVTLKQSALVSGPHAEADIHMHYIFSANLSQTIKFGIVTFLGQRQCYADTKAENC